MKARERNCDISGYLLVKIAKWRKRWLEVSEFVLYIFERHEVWTLTLTYNLYLLCILQDVSCKKTVSLPGYTVIYPVPVSFVLLLTVIACDRTPRTIQSCVSLILELSQYILRLRVRN